MAKCPRCGSEGFVNERTKDIEEAACLTERCRVVVFEVSERAFDG